MGFKINFYDKDEQSVPITDIQGEAVKAAIVQGKQAIAIGDNLYMTSSISSVKKDTTSINYKSPDQLGLTADNRTYENSEGYKKFQELKKSKLGKKYERNV